MNYSPFNCLHIELTRNDFFDMFQNLYDFIPKIDEFGKSRNAVTPAKPGPRSGTEMTLKRFSNLLRIHQICKKGCELWIRKIIIQK